MKTFLLIDANSLIHRFFHAVPPLTSPGGEPVGALYGLSRVLLRILIDEKTHYAAAAFDRKEKTFRTEMYEEYKGTRAPTAEDLIPQLKEAHNIFNGFGINTYDLAGYEADDIIGTLAEKFKREKDIKITILTGDLDALQLVEGDKVVVDTIKKGINDIVIYNETAVNERYGIGPDKITDYKGLVGDSSDNIKGVAGIGQKTATELLQTYGTIEEIFEELPLIPDKYSKKLKGQEEQALMSKKLATIVRDVPLGDIALQDIELKPPTTQKLKEFLESYGFTSLSRNL
jgi:DNA polymerase I